MSARYQIGSLEPVTGVGAHIQEMNCKSPSENEFVFWNKI